MISLVFLYVAFKDVNWGDFLQSLISINYIWLIPGIVSVIASFAIRAVRWKLLVDPVQKVGFNETFPSTMIGYMGNNILPFRLGDLLRAYSFSKDTGITK